MNAFIGLNGNKIKCLKIQFAYFIWRKRKEENRKKTKRSKLFPKSIKAQVQVPHTNTTKVMLLASYSAFLTFQSLKCKLKVKYMDF